MRPAAWAVAGVGAVVVATCFAAALVPRLARLLDRLLGDDDRVPR